MGGVARCETSGRQDPDSGRARFVIQLCGASRAGGTAHRALRGRGRSRARDRRHRLRFRHVRGLQQGGSGDRVQEAARTRAGRGDLVQAAVELRPGTPARMSDADYIIVGSGINALVCAAMLGRKGRRVLVLERNDRIGGCIRTEEITAPGFIHDVMATTFVLFITSPGYAVLGPALQKRGVTFVDSDLPTGVLLPDGRHAVLTKDRSRNIAALDALTAGDGASFAGQMDRFGANAGLVFGLLGGSLWSLATARLLLREGWKRGPRALVAFFGEALATGRAHLETSYRSEVTRALFAPWLLHTGLGPESAYG